MANCFSFDFRGHFRAVGFAGLIRKAWTAVFTQVVSDYLMDILAWMKEHHLLLNMAKAEVLIFPATPSVQHKITVQLDSSTIIPSSLARNFGVILDDQLTFKDHIAKTVRLCMFSLHNIRKITPFLTEHATQLRIQALAFLGWTIAMLFWLDFQPVQSDLCK
ncbi:putative RNA-directed DNA polymerase from transposon BS [Labeo rohita]|uniref:RNA-directed DNA polymerase from transposon BS n=1 Tax=Labeo rohita TaxID=84645 RepID=A0ABQ8LC65_LABRO|nr:putative RNA-directed DNA polymerase from transposon BS [Labeo rohita]